MKDVVPKLPELREQMARMINAEPQDLRVVRVKLTLMDIVSGDAQDVTIEEPSLDFGGGDERRCRVCGCTESNACVVDGVPCHWVEEDLCSACVGKGAGN